MFKYASLISILFIIYVAVADRLWFAGKYWEATPFALYSFWFLVYSSLLFLAGFYWLFVRDLSEALFIFLGPFILLQFGLEDISYFLIFFEPIPLELPWLKGLPLFISNLLGLKVVTNLSLLISVLFSFIIVLTLYFILKDLEMKNGKLYYGNRRLL